MLPTPYVASLRIYEPLSAFSPAEALRWSAIPSTNATNTEEQSRALTRIVTSEPPALKPDGAHLLEIDGIFCSVTCNNNFSGHGMYQFSPEFFLSTLTPKYGMEIKELFIAKISFPLIAASSNKLFIAENKEIESSCKGFV